MEAWRSVDLAGCARCKRLLGPTVGAVRLPVVEAGLDKNRDSIRWPKACRLHSLTAAVDRVDDTMDLEKYICR